MFTGKVRSYDREKTKKKTWKPYFSDYADLTIALGSVVLGCSMIWAVGSPQLVAVKLESQLANLVEDVQAAESVLASAQSAKPVGKYDALLADEALCRQQNIYAKTAASPNETTIVFAGDILFDDHYAVKVK